MEGSGSHTEFKDNEGNQEEEGMRRLESRKVKVTQLCLTLCNPTDNTVHGILQARILEWAAFPFSRRIFPTQGSNPGLLHCRRILYQLSHKESQKILAWVAYPFSSRSFYSRDQTGVSIGKVDSFPTELSGKPVNC